VTVTGATGTIGRALVRALQARGDQVTALSRDVDRARSLLGDVRALAWHRPEGEQCPLEALAGSDGVVHLLGEPLSQRWSASARRAIHDSRVLGTHNLVAGMRSAEPRPAVLVSQSAIGWYGSHSDEPLDEDAPPAGGDFLTGVVASWEAEAQAAQELGTRVVRTRTGVVLSRSGGALEKMLPAFKLGVGGPVAGGRQYVSWVHLDDVVGAMLFCLDDGRAEGPVNVTAPEPVTNRELARALGRVLHRPAVLPVPAFALRLVYGEMASVVTTGARVLPARLLSLGYSFAHPQLEQALRSALAAG
jgi:uncharacterized protein (TIGR01777 family)